MIEESAVHWTRLTSHVRARLKIKMPFTPTGEKVQKPVYGMGFA
jgi:hypothetical protein